MFDWFYVWYMKDKKHIFFDGEVNCNQNGLVTNISQNIFYLQQKIESNMGLELSKAE